MEFSVEFYVTSAGSCPVQEFLEGLKQTDPGDFAAVLAGLAKLRDRRYHAEPLSKALSDGLFELRHVGKLNTRILWFFMKGAANHCRARNPQQRPGGASARFKDRAGTNGGLVGERKVMKKTNFDRYLEEQLKDPSFAARYAQAGEAWDVALQLTALRQQAGLSQKEL